MDVSRHPDDVADRTVAEKLQEIGDLVFAAERRSTSVSDRIECGSTILDQQSNGDAAGDHLPRSGRSLERRFQPCDLARASQPRRRPCTQLLIRRIRSAKTPEIESENLEQRPVRA